MRAAVALLGEHPGVDCVGYSEMLSDGATAPAPTR